jgi:hypothetical protein
MPAPESCTVTAADLLAVIHHVGPATVEGPLRGPIEPIAGDPTTVGWAYADRSRELFTTVEIAAIVSRPNRGILIGASLCRASFGDDGPLLELAGYLGVVYGGEPHDRAVYDVIIERARECTSGKANQDTVFSRMCRIAHSVVGLNMQDTGPRRL